MAIDIHTFNPNSPLITGLADEVAPAAGVVVAFAAVNGTWSVLNAQGKSEQALYVGEPTYKALGEEQWNMSHGDVYAGDVGASRPIAEATPVNTGHEKAADGVGLAIMTGALALVVGIGVIKGADKLRAWAKSARN